jgi:hypothetical protein
MRRAPESGNRHVVVSPGTLANQMLVMWQEVFTMKRSKTLATILLGGALMIPAYAVAQTQEKTTTTTTTTETQRYYDPDLKVYHEWNKNEDRAYRMYLDQEHRDYMEFPKATTVQQTEYWKWRHNHPDKMIFKSETVEP